MLFKIKQRFLNLKFQGKIIGISVIISLIPTLLLGVFSYVRMRSLLTEREETALHETLHQEALQLDYKLNAYLTTMNFITWNENLRTALAKDYTANFEMYLAYRDTIDPMFLTIRSLNTDITAITVYTDTQIYPHGNTLRPLSEVQDAQWYQQALNSTAPFFYISEDSSCLYVICRMYYSYVPNTHIVCMTIDLPTAMSSVKNLFQNNFGFLLSGPSGSMVYQYANLSPNASGVSPDALSGGSLPEYIYECETLESSGWTAYLYRPTRSVLAAATNISYIVCAMILLCIALIVCISNLLSRIIVTPLEQLSANMDQVERGDYEISITSSGTDEVGQLIKSFQKMVYTLNNLVNEVLRAEIRQQKQEIEILQSQINPHFLYNSLSLINSKAILSGQKDISQMARLLSTFYRTMLNKGQQLTTVSSELENTKSYVSIQQMMHSQSFDAVYDIDESVLDCPIPSLLLQPLAENAILHGLDHRELPGRAILSISCFRQGQDIIFKIMDNGCGMSEEECRQILTKEGKGYGVKNVHQRARLYYGSSYGLTYHSTKGMGTYVILRICSQLPGEPAVTISGLNTAKSPYGSATPPAPDTRDL